MKLILDFYNLLKYKILIVFFLSMISCLSLRAKEISFYASNSVLSSGDWYKIRISSDGIYKLTYDDLLQMGISNPAHVQIRGYGGWMLDEDFSTTYYDDLPEIAVWMNKGSDNVFNSGDYLLFYGRASRKIARSGDYFLHTNNPYSDFGYYFVTQADSEPLQMDTTASVSQADSVVTTYSDYLIHEKDSVNLLESGREFYGESFFTTNSQDFSFQIPGIESWMGFNYNFILKSNAVQSLMFRLNGQPLYTNTIPANNNSFLVASSVTQTVYGASVSSVSESNVFNFSLENKGISNSYLNYLRLFFKRILQPYDAVTFFRNDLSTSINRYLIANASDQLIVLDVTANITPSFQETNYSNNQLSFVADASTLHEYALVDLADTIPTPEFLGKISNQNLHALEKKDLIILAPSVYKSYAQQIADLHTENDGFTSLVVSPDEIYNEFSSGNPDATAIRRFLKMFYDRGTSDSDRPKYLLLLGAGTYNNKFINSSLPDSLKDRYILTYESSNSLSETGSFVTDDYFGFLQEEGVLTIASAKLCLGIGRLPARNRKDAQTYVDKIASYMKNENKGIWKNNLCFLSDDAVGAKGYIPSTEMNHEIQSDKYAEYIQSHYPDFVVNKVYEDAYKRVSLPKGYRYPDAKKDLLQKLNSGQLILSYVGHGSPRDWTHEYLLKSLDYQSINNSKLSLWITATCDFSRFDALDVSGGELALSNPNGGAIALLSTVRQVYIANNDSMSTNIYKNIFKRDGEKALCLGDIIKNAKLSFSVNDENKTRFQLLGDPALRLSYPDQTYQVKLTSINGVDLSSDTAKLAALSFVKLEGQIVDVNSSLASDFSGKLSIVMFDAQQKLNTRDNGGDGSIFPYKDYLNTVYSGIVNVENGVFECKFTIPRDIFYSNNPGKMSFYAWETDGREAQGSFYKYKINGIDSTFVGDGLAPNIDAFYLNSSTFSSGDTVGVSPVLHVNLSDESGINLSSGMGHILRLLLDDRSQYDLASDFVASNSSATDGYIDYSFSNLSEGAHTLKFTAWDVCDNYTEQSIDFTVVEAKNSIFNWGVSLIENPVVHSADFMFSCDANASNILLQYEVYSLNGELMWSHKEIGAFQAMNNNLCSWNLKNEEAKSVYPGVYECKATVRINEVKQNTKTFKFVVLAQ